MPRDVMQIRTDSEFNRMIDDLASVWGGSLGPASRSAVIREAVRRAHVTETETREKSEPRKKSRKS